MNGKSLIVGATGSLGPAVASALREADQGIRLLVRDKTKAEKYFGKDADVEIVQGSAANPESVEEALENCTHLFYLVNVPYQHWSSMAKPLLETSVKAAIKKNIKLVFPGNVYNYGYAQYLPVDEKHPWEAHTKKGKIRIDLENYLRKEKEENKLKYTVIRMPDLYGPFVVNSFSEKAYINALKGKKIQWIGDLDIPSEYILSNDAGKAMVAAGLSEKSNGEEYNVPGYSPITSREYLTEIANQAGCGSKISTFNSDLLFSVLGTFNPLIKEVKEMLYLKRTEIILDGSKYKKTFGDIQARTYKDGVAATLDWVKDFYNIN